MASVAAAAAGPAGAAPAPFLSHFHTTTEIASAVPANGDQNPYGVATVPFSIGNLVGGDTLVSNFNASNNLQGTGTTIVEVLRPRRGGEHIRPDRPGNAARRMPRRRRADRRHSAC